MQSFKRHAARLLAATWMCLCAAAAQAAPVYHVDIDTSSLGGGTAWLGLSFLGLGGAAPASATVSHLAGDLLGAPEAMGAVTGGPPADLTFTDDGGGGDWTQAIQLGGHFTFDVGFLLADGNDGTTFSWSLFDDTHYLGVDGDLGSIELHPDAPDGQRLSFTPDNAYSQVRAVPEPSAPLLVALAGFGLVFVRRRGGSGRT